MVLTACPLVRTYRTGAQRLHAAERVRLTLTLLVADTFHNSDEAWIGTKAIKQRIDFKVDHIKRSLFVRLQNILTCLVLHCQSYVDRGYAVGRNKLLTGPLLQVSKDLKCLGLSA